MRRSQLSFALVVLFTFVTVAALLALYFSQMVSFAAPAAPVDTGAPPSGGAASQSEPPAPDSTEVAQPGDGDEVPSGSAEAGQQIAQQLGCLGCHSVDGSRLVGPTLLGLSGSDREFESGETVTADFAYLQRSILDPNAQVVKGYPPNLMPTFEGRLDDTQLQDILAYIHSLQ